MKNKKLLANLVMTKEISKYLKNLDDYDDPCFILIKMATEDTLGLQIVKDVVSSKEPYSYVSFVINSELLFLSILFEEEKIKEIISAINTALEKNNIVNQISGFRHNCLGEPEETFLWCGLLLEEVCENSKEELQYKINDFQDRENWPGIKKYMDLDK